MLQVKNLKPGTKYYLHVRTHCSSTNISEWNTLAFYTSGIATTPNPTSNMIRITLYGDDINNESFELYDGVGKLLKKIKITGNISEISMREFASGIYFITYRRNNIKYRAQILKVAL